MTPPALRKERIDKFRAIVSVWLADSPTITDVNGDSDILEAEIRKVAEQLANASISRTEHKTDEVQGIYQSKTTAKDIKGIEAAMFAKRPINDGDLKRTVREATIAFEASFSAEKSLTWYSPKKGWATLRDFVTEKFIENPNCFEEYKTWRKTLYVKGAVSLVQVRQDPECFIASWAAFMESKPVVQVGEITKDKDGAPASW